MSEKRILAFDFGASSGRAVLGSLQGGKICTQEIHRFSNDPVTVNGTMYWDILRLFYEMKQGIAKALLQGGFDAIGIDTWGVDFGILDKDGKLIANPVHYRDRRTVGMPEKVFQKVSKEALYSRTGIQFMHFNTLYQLAYLAEYSPQVLEQADKILMIPDLLAYFLTGKKYGEVTNLSTTNAFCTARDTWDTELCEMLGIPTHILPEVIHAGDIYGDLSAEICEEFSCKPVPVIAAPTHDTASAVAACPAEEEDFVYISSGTWSLFGTESKQPVMTPEAMQANFTNELGYEGTTRFLKNIMGLWIIQESRRQWIREGQDVDFNTLEKEAMEAEGFRCYIDVDDPAFETAGNLPQRIIQYCKDTGQYVPQSRGEIMRCIYQSIAMKYKHTFLNLEQIMGKRYQRIHMIGGGIKDTLLCRLTSSACGVQVDAGPVEATVTGNLAVCYITLGEIRTLSHARQIIRESTQIKTYLPEEKELWQWEYETYLKLLNKEQ